MSWAPGSSVELETERFVLRSLTAGDAGARYVGWLNDAEVMRFVNARVETHDLESVRSFVDGHDNRTAFLLGIFVREGGLHIGNYEARVDTQDGRAHIGVLIGDRDWWGCRVVIEAQEALLAFLFREVGIEKVCGQCYASNRAALFNYQAQGFETEGILRSHVELEGGRDDVVQFSLSASAWQARRSKVQ